MMFAVGFASIFDFGDDVGSTFGGFGADSECLTSKQGINVCKVQSYLSDDFNTYLQIR